MPVMSMLDYDVSGDVDNDNAYYTDDGDDDDSGDDDACAGAHVDDYAGDG